MKKVLVSIVRELSSFFFIFFKPRTLFNRIKIKPSPFMPIVIFLSVVVLTIFQKISLESKALKIVFFSLLVFLFYLFILFLKSSIILIGIKLLKGNSDFDLLFVAFTYSLAPFIIAYSFRWIFPLDPFHSGNIAINVLIMLLARIYYIILSILAISILANFSYGKSILAFLPWLIIWFFLGL